MSELVSVIIPVYNVESYIGECIKTLESQTYTDIEIILVDDGSTDTSGDICEGLKIEDPRIKVIHKPNGGLSDARNRGVEEANGKYVVFVDGDDFVDTHYIEHLYNLVSIEKADIGICDIVHYYAGGDTSCFEISKEHRVLSAKEATVSMLYQNDFLVTACAKIFPKQYFDDLKFPVGMLFEDSAIMYKLFAKAETIIYNKSKIYAYVHRENSITTNKFTKRDCDILKICNEMSQFLETGDEEVSKAVKAYYSSACLRIYLNAPNTSEFEEELLFCCSYIKQFGKDVIKDKRARKKNKYAIAMFLTCPPLLRLSYKHVDRWK